MITTPRHAPARSFDRRAILWNLVIFLVFFCGAGIRLYYEGELPIPDVKRIEAGNRERHWQSKIRIRKKGNILLLGDSRINHGLSPTIIQAQLPEGSWRGFNLGFNGGGLNPTIFEFAESRLDQDPGTKIIVLGVTPGSLTLQSSKNHQFEQLQRRSWLTAMAYMFFPTIVGTLSKEPVSLENELFYGLGEFHEDGWEGALRLPNEWPDAWLPGMRRLFDKDRIRPELWDGLMEQTRKWSNQGIYVIGFRPPTSAAMIEIENKNGNFDVARFEQEFEAHGGHWISIDASRYRPYDNSHLPLSEAIRLSEEVGQRIAAIISDRSDD